MKTMHKIEKKQRGFTLIEFMVVIALIGLGLVLVVTQFGQASASNKSQTSVRNISSLISGITGLKDTRNGYKGITTAVLLQTNAVPQNMKGTANAITNVFDGSVTVSAPTTAPYTPYTLTLAKVTQEACTEIAAKFLGAKDSSITFIAAAPEATSGTAATAPTTGMATIGDAQTQCASATTGTSTLFIKGS